MVLFLVIFIDPFPASVGPFFPIQENTAVKRAPK